MIASFCGKIIRQTTYKLLLQLAYFYRRCLKSFLVCFLMGHSVYACMSWNFISNKNNKLHLLGHESNHGNNAFGAALKATCRFLFTLSRHFLFSENASPKPGQKSRATLMVFVIAQCR